jgi:hypothetical protein
MIQQQMQLYRSFRAPVQTLIRTRLLST